MVYTIAAVYLSLSSAWLGAGWSDPGPEKWKGSVSYTKSSPPAGVGVSRERKKEEGAPGGVGLGKVVPGLGAAAASPAGAGTAEGAGRVAVISPGERGVTGPGAMASVLAEGWGVPTGTGVPTGSKSGARGASS